mmetsp:Transcript_8084/g.17265  ORF Transcript_8084/g.17265 Transcript_8084/m.17265 type:complete len:215 (-) Transcript_8084:198-842(-)
MTFLSWVSEDWLPVVGPEVGFHLPPDGLEEPAAQRREGQEQPPHMGVQACPCLLVAVVGQGRPAPARLSEGDRPRETHRLPVSALSTQFSPSIPRLSPSAGIPRFRPSSIPRFPAAADPHPSNRPDPLPRPPVSSSRTPAALSQLAPLDAAAAPPPPLRFRVSAPGGFHLDPGRYHLDRRFPELRSRIPPHPPSLTTPRSRSPRPPSSRPSAPT